MRVGITNDTVIAFEEAFLAKLYPERRDFVLESPGSDIFEGYRAGLASALMVAQIQILEAAANIAEAHKGSAEKERRLREKRAPVYEFSVSADSRAEGLDK